MLAEDYDIIPISNLQQSTRLMLAEVYDIIPISNLQQSTGLMLAEVYDIIPISNLQQSTGLLKQGELTISTFIFDECNQYKGVTADAKRIDFSCQSFYNFVTLLN